MRTKTVGVILAALWLGLGSGSTAAQTDRLGRLTFPATGKSEAASHFVHGVLLLHSFEYDDAREQFVAAEQADPAFVMAYWGQAMSFNQSIWWRVDLDGARAALRKLGPSTDARLAKAPTARERGYLEAVEALFGEGDKSARDRAYSERMSRLTRDFPDDDEASLFYALSLLAATEGVRDGSTYLRAAALAEKVFAKNPQHPGAAHYLIHCYDDPGHAQQGLAAARAYSSIAPAAQHALHMPSHVFYALGMWDEAAKLNEASAAAGDERLRAKQLGVEERGFHALLWLEYAYLQQGRRADARRLVETMVSDNAKSGSPRTRLHLAAMRAAWIVDTNGASWLPPSPDLKGLNAAVTASDRFATGFTAVRTGDLAVAKQALDMMAQPPSSHYASPHHPGAAPATMDEIMRAQANVMRLELEALVAAAEKRHEDALTLADRAAAIEDSVTFEYGPPVPVKPANELRGELLLNLGRAADAQSAFERVLARQPRRALSVLGLARAAAAAGATGASKRAYKDLREIWHASDADLPEHAEVFGGSPGRAGRHR
jgi:tetratricopeptide (TPR) repeat protein